MPNFQVGVQFVQVGYTEMVNRWLKILDDKIRVLYGIRDVSIWPPVRFNNLFVLYANVFSDLRYTDI
jgi:hypothetical protein